MADLTRDMYAKYVEVATPSVSLATSLLDDNYPVCPFSDGKDITPSDVTYTDGIDLTLPLRNSHCGQRKLLLSEIDFLTKANVTVPTIVVYAGAACGRHIPLLSEMFPLIIFHLYDPRPFDSSLLDCPRIYINPYSTDRNSKTYGFFTMSLAKKYRAMNVLLISDIRSTSNGSQVAKNMAEQSSWVTVMHPQWSMLKFRLPWPKVGTTYKHWYLDGECNLQCWAGVNSAETRLIVPPYKSLLPPIKEWDIVHLERSCSWHNRVLRTHDFSNDRLDEMKVYTPGTVAEFWDFISHDGPFGYDYVHELQILSRYLFMPGQEHTKTRLREVVKEINAHLVNVNASFVDMLKQ
jgi:hypothetical protein